MITTSLFFAFGLYFAILAVIAVASHSVMRTSTDFILGNRSLSFWLTALSAHASDMSAWLFMAFPAAVYLYGLSQVWTALGLFLGMLLNWKLVARKLRVATEAYGANTLSTYFERRFGDDTGILRVLTAAMLVLFMSCYLCAGLIAMGFLLESVFGVNYYWGMTIAALFVTAYTFAGGFITVAWTDLFQALFLIVMITLVPITALGYLGNGDISIGWTEVLTVARDQNIPLSPLGEMTPLGFVNLIFLALGWGLGYFGQPHIITKFMGIRHPADLRKSMYLGMTWQAMALTAATLCGLVGIAFFPQGLGNHELVFVEMVKLLYNPFWAGFILCAILAANMSTMDSQVLVCASTLSEDLWVKFIQPHATPRQRLRITRLCVIAITFLALIVAFYKSTTVLNAVLYAWTGLGCSFGPVVLLSLYYPQVDRYGAFAGIFVGGTVAALWDLFYPYGEFLAMPAMIPAFALSCLSILAISRRQTLEENPSSPLSTTPP